MDQYGRKGDAYTDWYLKWNYPRLLSEGRCTTGPVTVSLEVKYNLPKLETLPNISSDLKTKWEKYTQNLATHEKGHKDFCIGEGILNKIRDHDKQYDQETDHGATQGARFP